MYCKKCGTQNADGAGFCKNCGTSLRQPSAPAQPVQPEQNLYAPPQNNSATTQQNFGQPQNYGQPAQNLYAPPQNSTVPPQQNFGQPQNYGQPAQNLYAPPQNYAPAMGGYGRTSSPLSKLNIFHWIAMVLLLLTFIGMFTPWYTLKASMSMSYQGKSQSDSKKENKSFFDILDSDNDDGSVEINGKNYSSDKDKFDTRNNLCKWFGLAGFITAVAAIALAFVNPKLLLCVSALSTVCFIVAFIAGLSAASVLDDTLNNVLETYLKNYKRFNPDVSSSVKIGIGLIISFACSVAATVMAIVAAFCKKKPQTNAYGMGTF